MRRLRQAADLLVARVEGGVGPRSAGALNDALPAVSGRLSRHRLTIVGFLLLLTVVNFVDRGALSYASAPIIDAYGFNKAAWGAVLGYFGYGYVFGALLGGVLSDHWGPKRVWVMAGAGWSVFEIATAFAGDIGLQFFGGSALLGFATLRVLFGLSEGPAFSLLNKSVSQWTAPRERGLMSSLTVLSGPLGAMISAPVSVGLLVVTHDWRWMFVLLGLASLLILVAFTWVFTDRPEQNARVSAAELAMIRRVDGSTRHRSIGDDGRPFFMAGDLILNALGFFSSLYVTFLVLTWIPKYLQDAYRLHLGSLSYIGMFPWLGACFTIVLGGWLSDRILSRTGNLRFARSYMSAASLLVVATALALVPFVHSLALALALISLANAANSLPNSVYYNIVTESSPEAMIGTFSGITLMIASASSIVAPTITGLIVNRFSYDDMFLSASLVALAGMGCMLMVRLKPRAGEAPNSPAPV